MIHSSFYKPRVYPYKAGLCLSTQIDRVQELTASATLNRTKIEEIGRDGIVCWRKGTPIVTLTLRQLEYGDVEFFRKLANGLDATVKFEMKDYKTPAAGIAGYMTDDDAAFLGTVWYPKTRLTGLGLAIGDPDATIERTFSLVGEDEITLQGNNKYLIELVDNSCAGAAHTIVIGTAPWNNYPTPIEDPDRAGSDKYMFRVTRERGGVATDLVDGTDFTYTSGNTTITIPNSLAADVYKVYYSAGSYITASEIFTDNDTDLCSISAESVSIYLATGNYLYRLQSVGIDVAWDRQDVKEIGNIDVVARGARDITCRITLGRILENYTVEEVLRGKAADYGKIDIRKFVDDAVLTVKIYEDDTKNTFKLGYEFKDLTPVGIDDGTPLNDYVTKGVTMEGEEGFVTSLESDLTTVSSSSSASSSSSSSSSSTSSSSSSFSSSSSSSSTAA